MTWCIVVEYNDFNFNININKINYISLTYILSDDALTDRMGLCSKSVLCISDLFMHKVNANVEALGLYVKQPYINTYMHTYVRW